MIFCFVSRRLYKIIYSVTCDITTTAFFSSDVFNSGLGLAVQGSPTVTQHVVFVEFSSLLFHSIEL